jgi:hypothetical protein
MITDTIKAIGNLEILRYDGNGNLLENRKENNLVVHVGKVHMTQRLQSNTNPVMSHMAFGTANVAAVTSQTTLLTENARVPLDSSTVTNNTITYVATFGAGTPDGGATISEAGIFNNPTANTGTMLCRVRFNEVNKANSDIIVITWNVTIQ